MRKRVDKARHIALQDVLDDPPPENLLKQSRLFAKRAGIASVELLSLADKAIELGALGSTQNMIGKAIHALIRKEALASFIKSFSKYARGGLIFVSDLIHSGPTLS